MKPVLFLLDSKRNTTTRIKKMTLRLGTATLRRFFAVGARQSFLIANLLIYTMLIQSLLILPVKAAEKPKSTQQDISTSKLTESEIDPFNRQETEPVIVFGPRTFSRRAFQTRYVENFEVAADVTGPYKIIVDNGDNDGKNRVFDGTVYLNDILVAGSSKLNLQTRSSNKEIILYSRNVLDVSFLSRSRSNLTITIIGTRSRLPGRGQPVIHNFSPSSGTTGNTVTINGINLTSIRTPGTIGTPTVTFAGVNNTRKAATVSSATNTQLKVIVPGGVVTGQIEVINDQGRAMSRDSFNVESELDYQITPMPASVSAVQLTSSTQVVAVTSQRPDFTQLVTLSVSNLPNGVTAKFEPQAITAGATSTLTLELRKANLSPGSYSFMIKGSALVNGTVLNKSASAELNIISAGQTNLTGRVLSTEEEPIMGATVSVQPEGRSTVTDAAGNFILTNVTAGTNRPIQIDGRTANAPNRTYPVIQEPATIVAGQTNENPFIYHLPPIDRQFEVQINPTQATPVSNGKVDNLVMTIPANAQLRNRDNTPVDRVSITPLPPDRTPAPIPSNLSANIVYTGQPGGAVSANGTRIPVTFPNLDGENPGTRIELYAFDHDTVEWYRYGFGRVSSDGKTIVPEIDPSTGQPYGLRDFSWFFPAVASPDGNPGGDDGSGPPEDCMGECCSPGSGGGGASPGSFGGDGYTRNMVDLSTGIKIETTTDIYISGARGSLELKRVDTSDLTVFCLSCPFGSGITHNYDVRLTGNFNENGAGRVVMPGEGNGRLFSYERTDADGSFVFLTTAATGQLGDTLRRFTDGTYEYRYAQGEVFRFDTNRRLVAMVDSNGNTNTLTYTGTRLTSITDEVGRSITLTYDASNRIITATDPLNRIWRYGYSGSRLANVTDPENNITRYTYQGIGGRLSKITDARGNDVKQITYDNTARVIQQKFADNSTETYSYTFAGGTISGVSITDNLLRQEKKRFNANGQVIERTDALGQNVKLDREINTNVPTKITGSCGCAEETRQFDTRGNIVARTDRLGQTESFEYHPVFNKITKYTDKLNRITTYTYDSQGNLTSTTNPLNETTAFTYDANGQMTSVTDPLNHTTTFQYDSQGNLTQVTDALNHSVNMTYDAVGRMTSVTDALGRQTSYTYDNLDRVLSIKDSNNKTTSFTYDANGNLLTRKNALNQTTSYAYDSKNRLASVTDAVGNVTRFGYNSDDELTTVLSPLGRKTLYSYDGRGQVKTITDPLGNSVNLTYDNKRQLTTLADERNNVTTFVYDELSRLTSKRDPLGKTNSYVYDAVGNIVETIDRLSRSATFQYDAANRIKKAIYSDATVNYAYDAAGRLTTITDTQGGTLEYAYDAADRLLSEKMPAGMVSYAYNNADQQASMTVENRPAVNYAYDTAGRLKTITQGSENFTYNYDDLSRMSSMLRPNGIRTEYAYDAAGRLSRLAHLNQQDQAIEDFTYTYNPDSEIESISSLFSAQLLANARTANTADAANRITQFGGATYAFNSEGETTSKTDNQGTTNYNWDARGRLSQVSLPNGQTVSYNYDALGRRVNRSTGSASTMFLYDGDDVVLDKNSDQTAIDYLNGQFIDNKLRLTNNAGKSYFQQDHLSSTVALTDAAGNVSERISYEPFGESVGSAITRYDYTGRERDSATGLLYYRARWLDPKQGRFISEDSIGFEGGNNFYAYTNNSPINYSDPTGNIAFIPLILLAIEIGAAAYAGKDFYDTLNNPCSSLGDKLWSGAGLGLGLVGAGLGGVALKQSLRGAKLGEGGLNLFKFGSPQATKSTGWKQGDYFLNLPNQGTPKLNWKQNYGALRREMGQNKPIYDSYRLPNGDLIPSGKGTFLNAERYILESRGWTYNPRNGAWMPPK